MTQIFADSFREHVSPRVVRIYRCWQGAYRCWRGAKGECTAYGTGFLFSVGKDEVGGRAYVIATARHVVADIDADQVEWQLVREASEGTKVLTFESAGRLEYKGSPLLLRPEEPWYDAALLLVRETSAATPFFSADLSPPPIIRPKFALLAGSPVAWAGYPHFIEKMLERPQLCYYDGKVSALITTTPVPTYLVDGHAVQGVSGGPVWHADETGIRIVGIVSGYWGPNEIAGFCHFATINELAEHFCDTYSPDVT